MGPDTQDKAAHLTAATGHPSEDAIATCHPPGIAGDVAGKIVQHRFAFRQLWKKYGEEFHRLSSRRDRVGLRPTSEFEFRYWPSVLQDVAFLLEDGLGSEVAFQFDAGPVHDRTLPPVPLRRC